jgi:hypothetical protein
MKYRLEQQKFSEKVNKIDKSLARLIRKKKGDCINIRHESGGTTNDFREIKRIIGKYYANLFYTNRLDNI